ncbi:tripartite tricarboxylate transporter substrate binding protein [Ammoniphilus resinae]|uniref:Tripartite-type tricarboxylate transporter receptor subunit TctC n=1 Tax=Ammoniphilus resinae TaxID=861532 RepID=A0ABS4GL71_9BACL|nr:tripartite tricarboxylate transporter substrate binding protein [Ammoniphilus resinae]MBP1930847.1 tripartite-type tricarboxylate transporter receptor subunit TctC [Ammoniphilus resinae]
MRKHKKAGFVMSLVLASMMAIVGCSTQNTSNQSTTTAATPPKEAPAPVETAPKDTFPNGPVNLIVPFGPGGSADLAARAIAATVPKYLGQAVIVVNKPGASGEVAHTDFLKEKPDGYNMIISGNSPSTVVPNVRQVKYDPFTDFEFLVRITNSRDAVFVNSQKEWNTMEELIEHARANPGKVQLGTSGTGGIDEFIIRSINRAEGVEIVPMPFNSGGEAQIAAVGGHVDGFVSSVVSGKPALDSGQLKILAVNADTRDPNVPDVLTLKEQGIEAALNNNIAIAVPKGTPKEIKDKLISALKQTIEDESFISMAKKLNMTIDYLEGDEVKNKVKEDYDLVKEVLAATKK